MALLHIFVPKTPTELRKGIILLLLTIIALSAFTQTPAPPLSQRLTHIDTTKYKLPAKDSTPLKFTRIVDRSKLAINYYSIIAGKIQPQAGFGHSHRLSLPSIQELYVLLNGEAEFTVNGRTSRLKAPVILPVQKEDTLVVYNPTNDTLHWFSFVVSDMKGRRDSIVPLKKHTEAKLDDTPAFAFRKLNGEALKPVASPWKTSGIPYERMLGKGAFAPNWKYVDHLVIPADSATALRRLRDIEEVYYVIKGSGRATVDSETVAIGPYNTFTGLAGEDVSFTNNGNGDLELLVVGIADKIQKSFFTPYIVALILSFLISLTVYIRPVPSESYLKLFPPFLLLTIFMEYWGHYLTIRGQNNMMQYNFFTLFEFLYYLIIISLIITSVKMKKTIMITLVLYTLLAIVNILFIQDSKQFHSMGYSLGCLIIVTFCVYFFLELFRSPKSIKLANNPAFWICSGLLFFYCCGFPLWALAKYWEDISSVVLKNFAQIVMILNVFLYSIFTIAFICIRTRKYSSSPS